ncbi:MAG: CAP domain-containing protein [bacterium]|nr:CAP domain-containing protein [bacterium]
MKRYGLLLGTILFGAVGMTSCAKEESTESYKHINTESSVQEETVVTENTAPVQTDNEAEAQNLEANTNSNKEETESKGVVVTPSYEAASDVTNNEKTSNKDEETKEKQQEKQKDSQSVVTTTAPTKAAEKGKISYQINGNSVIIMGSSNCTKAPVKTSAPSQTKKPVATKAPVKTEKPVQTERPVQTQKPVMTQKPVVTSSPAATKKPSTDSGNDNGTSVSSKASQVLAIVNEERAKQGLSALTTTTALNNAATKRAKEIVSNFSHTRPDGTSGVTVLKEYGISYMAWGENIAYGQKSASAVMDSWMNSAGHRANILSSKFGKVGIGCYELNGVLYWTQVFTN